MKDKTCDDSMALPEGKTCADCFHIKRCESLGFSWRERKQCDFGPSRFYEPPKAITSNPQVLGDKPVIKGTRFSVAQMLAEIADRPDQTLYQIADGYDIEVEKWQAALNELASLYNSGDHVLVKKPDIEEQINALNHWLHLYAPEMSGKKYIKETKRVMKKTGVIGYITDRLETLRSYLKEGE